VTFPLSHLFDLSAHAVSPGHPHHPFACEFFLQRLCRRSYPQFYFYTSFTFQVDSRPGLFARAPLLTRLLFRPSVRRRLLLPRLLSLTYLRSRPLLGMVPPYLAHADARTFPSPRRIRFFPPELLKPLFSTGCRIPLISFQPHSPSGRPDLKDVHSFLLFPLPPPTAFLMVTKVSSKPRSSSAAAGPLLSRTSFFSAQKAPSFDRAALRSPIHLRRGLFISRPRLFQLPAAARLSFLLSESLLRSLISHFLFSYSMSLPSLAVRYSLPVLVAAAHVNIHLPMLIEVLASYCTLFFRGYFFPEPFFLTVPTNSHQDPVCCFSLLGPPLGLD